MGIHPCCLYEIVGRNTGDFGYVFRRIFFNRLLQGLKSLGPAFNICMIIKIFLYNYMHHPIDPGHIGAQVLSQPEGRKPS